MLYFLRRVFWLFNFIYWHFVWQNVNNGAWNVVRKQLYVAATIESWAMVNFCADKIRTSSCEKFMNDLWKCCGELGMYLYRARSNQSLTFVQEWVSFLVYQTDRHIKSCDRSRSTPWCLQRDRTQCSGRTYRSFLSYGLNMKFHAKYCCSNWMA